MISHPPDVRTPDVRAAERPGPAPPSPAPDRAYRLRRLFAQGRKEAPMRFLRFAAAALLAVAAGLLIMPNAASAHGAMMMPGSRTYFCYLDGHDPVTGQIIPHNAACAAAVAKSGANLALQLVRRAPVGRCRPGRRLHPRRPAVQRRYRRTVRLHRVQPGPQRLAGDPPDGRRDDASSTTTTGRSTPARSRSTSPRTARPDPTAGLERPRPDAVLPGDQPARRTAARAPTTGTTTGRRTLPSGKSGQHLIYSVWSRSDSTGDLLRLLGRDLRRRQR